MKEWRQPRHDDFKPRTVWSLFNAFTEVAKETSLFSLPKRTITLHGLMDSQAGFTVGGRVSAGCSDTEVEINN